MKSGCTGLCGLCGCGGWDGIRAEIAPVPTPCRAIGQDERVGGFGQAAVLQALELFGQLNEHPREPGFVAADGFEGAGVDGVGLPDVRLCNHSLGIRIAGGLLHGFAEAVEGEDIVFDGGETVQTPVEIDDALGHLRFADADGAQFFHVIGAEAHVGADFAGLVHEFLAGDGMVEAAEG